jgi:hypothetical protein
MSVNKIIPYRANLSAALFPFASAADLGPTVIDPGADQNYDKRIDPDGQTKIVGIPQATYMANVMPTVEGYSSLNAYNPEIGLVKETYFKEFDILVPDTSSGQVIFTQVKLKIPVTATQLKAVCQYGQVATWTQSVDFPWIAQADYKTITEITSLKVGSRVFLFVHLGVSPENIVYEVLSTAGILAFFAVVFSPVNFVSLNNIHAATTSFNYLILANNNTIYWSSLSNPLDFTSSLVTGAGSIDPNNNPINILHLRATSTGFYIFTGTNIIQAVYTGNSRYPFKFHEVSNAGVVPKPENTTVSSGADTAFCVSADGNVSMLSGSSSELVAPELSTFLERMSVIDTYDSATDTWGVRIHDMDDVQGFAVQKPYYYSSTKLRQCPIILHNDRYVCVSAGRGSYTFSFGGSSAELQRYKFVYIYDRLLKRYGRIYYPHTQMMSRGDMLCLYNPDTGITIYIDFARSASVALPAGTPVSDFNAVLILGKFQLSRDEFVELHELKMIGANGVKVEYTYDGNTKVGVTSLYLKSYVASIPSSSWYLSRLACRNFSLVITGDFDLKSVEMKLTGAGNE